MSDLLAKGNATGAHWALGITLIVVYLAFVWAKRRNKL